MTEPYRADPAGPADHLRLAVFGAINTGKSSIVNALLRDRVARTSARGGETVEVAEHRVSLLEGRLGHTDFGLVIIDTPGIAELGGGANEASAIATAARADLVLFILASDITEREITALRHLHELGKPVLVVLNKADQMSPAARAEVLHRLHRRLDPLIGPANLIPIAAAPFARVVLFDPATGREFEEDRERAPRIDALEERILAIARTEGKALITLSRALDAVERGRQEKAARRRHADDVIAEWSAGIALATAVNPVPLLDLALGAGAIAKLLDSLAKLYDVPLPLGEQQKVAKVLWETGRSELAGTLAVALGGTLLKSVPGFGTVAGGLLQAGATGYFVYIVGTAGAVYLENGKTWPGDDAERTLRTVIASVDKDSITAMIRERVRARIGAGQTKPGGG